MSQSTELLPCPFCGSDQIHIDATCPEDHFVYCESCHTEGPLHLTPEEAIAKWNIRKNYNPLNKDVIRKLANESLRITTDGKGHYICVDSFCRAIASVKREPQWLPIASAPKGRKLIVGYHNKLGNWRTIIARYYLPGTLAAHEDADESQCDEEGYAKEGWYEESETHEFIMPTDEAPTYYMLLTPEPVTATTASRDKGSE